MFVVKFAESKKRRPEQLHYVAYVYTVLLNNETPKKYH